MAQLPLFQPPAWTVSDLTRYLRELLENDFNLQDLWVAGEVSNLSRPSSGHLYFTLKDAGASLRCVMWRNALLRQAYLPGDGEAVEVHGAIGIYEAGGTYQLYADLLRPAGEGALFQEFLRLKARLEAEGLFDPARKRPLPAWPATLGIVTSPTGAALRDMLDTIRRRFPLARVVLAPTPVQGDEAPAGIVSALERLNRLVGPALILLARGGGSIEDLWAFNDERVVRAIVASPAPVIAGVGHETDFTLADFAADLRAPTPTAAAELATPDQVELRLDLAEARSRLEGSIEAVLISGRGQLSEARVRLRLLTPMGRVRRDRQRLDELARFASLGLAHGLAIRQARLAGLQERLFSLNPMTILERGYSLVTKPDGTPVRRVAQVQVDEDLSVRVSDGSFGVRVRGTERNSARKSAGNSDGISAKG